MAAAFHEQSVFQSHDDGRGLLLGGEGERDAVTMGGNVLPLPRLLISLLSLMVELRPRVSLCHVPSSLMQNTRDQTEPQHEEHGKGKDWAGLGKKEPWRDKVLGHVACD